MPTMPQTSFTAGELSPSLYGRIDFAKYYSGLKTCKNFIVRQYGGVTNRPGTQFIAPCKSGSTAVRIIPFEFSTEQTYILEFGEYYMRVFKDGGQVVSGETPVEIATPWPASVLSRISYTQDADTLTVCHPNYAPRQITRSSHTAWSIAVFSNEEGPFADTNVDDTKTISISGVTGNISISAGADIFSSDMVGRLLYIEQMPESATPVWEVAKDTYQGNIRKSGSNYYKAVSSNASPYRITGTYKPDHDEGNAWDGSGVLEGDVYRPPGTDTNYDAYVGVEWEYLHSGYGIVDITGYTNARLVSATVLKRLPDSITSTATYKWAMEAWGGADKYPGTSTYFQQRQVFGGSYAFPQTLWMSRIQGYNNFGTSVPILDDDSITVKMDSREVNEVRHLIELQELVVLTSGGEWIARGSQDGVVTPSTINIKRQGYNGASWMPPLIIGSNAIYVQSKGSLVLTLGYDFARDQWRGTDLTIMSSHLFQGHTLTDWCYQQNPFSTVWAVRNDGKLLGLTYLPEHDVIAWHWHETDGEYESVACVSEGTEDAVYCVVKRTVDDTEVRYVERFNSGLFTDISDAKYLDSFLTYDGEPEDTFENLDHLEGKVVGVIADGFNAGTFTVTGGQIQLPRAYSKVTIGLPYVCDIETLEISSAQQEIRSKNKLIHHVHMICENTYGLQAGPDFSQLIDVKQRAAEPYDSQMDPITGITDVRIPARWDKAGRVAIRQDKPLPTTILSVIPDITTAGS